MYNWNSDLTESQVYRNFNLILIAVAITSAFLIFFIFHPQIVEISEKSPILINIMFVPVCVVGFIYGVKITSKVINPGEIRSPLKRNIVKLFLLFFVIGGLFSSVNFALNGGGLTPNESIFKVGFFEWFNGIITNNGGATFLVISSITIMAAATRRIVGLGGQVNRIITFVSTFIFFSMISLSFSQGDPSNSEVYLYTFYQAGIIGGALFQMNRLTANLNSWENYANEYY